jgi:hypothetical protein
LSKILNGLARANWVYQAKPEFSHLLMMPVRKRMLLTANWLIQSGIQNSFAIFIATPLKLTSHDRNLAMPTTPFTP